MKLLYVVHQFLPRHMTGTEQYVRSVAKGMQALGHEVHVLAYEPQIQAVPGEPGWFAHDEVVDGIPVHRLAIHLELTPNRELADYHNPVVREMFLRFLADRQFDLVHVFHLRYLGLCGIEDPVRLGIPVVVNLMDFWFLCPNFLLLRRDGSLCDGPPESGYGCASCLDPTLGEDLEAADLKASLLARSSVPVTSRYAATTVSRATALVGRQPRLLKTLSRADAVLAPSKFLADMFAKAGFPAERLQACAYGVDADRFAGQGKKTAATSAEPLRVGYVGSITEHKGLHVLIDAVAGMDAGAVSLHVHGHPDTHPEYTERVMALAAGDPRIVFHGGFEPTQLGKVLASLQLIVVPSLWYENTPFSVLEAQAFGLPVLASDLGGMSEVVREGEGGFLAKPGDVEDVRRRLQEIVDNRQLLSRAQATVRTLAENLAQLQQVYGAVCANRVSK